MTETLGLFDSRSLQSSTPSSYSVQELDGGTVRAIASLINFAVYRGAEDFDWDPERIGVVTPDVVDKMPITEGWDGVHGAGYIPVLCSIPDVKIKLRIPMNLGFSGGFLAPAGFESHYGPGTVQRVITELDKGIPWDVGPFPVQHFSKAENESSPGVSCSKSTSPSAKSPKRRNRKR